MRARLDPTRASTYESDDPRVLDSRGPNGRRCTPRSFAPAAGLIETSGWRDTCTSSLQLN